MRIKRYPMLSGLLLQGIGTLRYIGRQRDGNGEKTLYDIA